MLFSRQLLRDELMGILTAAISLVTRDECEGYAFGSVCMSVPACNSKTIAPIDLIFVHKYYYSRGSVHLIDYPHRDPDLDSRIY